MRCGQNMRLEAFIKRLSALEASVKPRMISTLADYVLWASEEDNDEDVEFSPEIMKFIEEAHAHAEEKEKSTS
ncbi:Uncharacterised protein [uncultured archaeon]|nr:Uncharacterised protein [uncultured archaeon]